MHQSNRILLIVVGMLVFSTQLFAQIGFIGRRNEINLLPFSLYYNTLNFQYKRVLTNHVGISLAYGHFKINKDFNELGLVNALGYEHFNSNFQSQMGYYYAEPLVLNKSSIIKGNELTLGLIFSSKYANVNLPAGYFWSYNWTIFNGSSNLNFEIKPEDLPYKLAATPPSFEFKYKIVAVSNTVEFGKEYMLTDQLTLTPSLITGFCLRNVTSVSSLQYNNYNLYYDAKYYTHFFETFPYYSPQLIGKYFSNSELAVFANSFFIFAPRLRIGYLF